MPSASLVEEVDGAVGIASYSPAAPKLTGRFRLTVYDNDKSVFHDTPVKRDYSQRAAWWNWAGVPTQYDCQLDYGTSTQFRLTIEGILLPSVTFLMEDGSEMELSDVETRVEETIVWRQKEDSHSYGSENYPLLAWPWQEYR